MDQNIIPPQNSNPSVTEQIHSLTSRIDSLESTVEIRGQEIDLLQIQLNEKKTSSWWKNHTFIISIVAILISLGSVINDVYKDHLASVTADKIRIATILQRLSEIRILQANSGPNLGPIQGATQNEASNLIQEVFDFINKNERSLTPEQYGQIIEAACRLDYSEKIIPIIDKALRLYPNNPANIAIRNWLVNHYYTDTGEFAKGRALIDTILLEIKGSNTSDDLKNFNLASEYLVWSFNELYHADRQIADSVLSVAENLLINTPEAWRYSETPLVADINNQRRILNQADSLKHR